MNWHKFKQKFWKSEINYPFNGEDCISKQFGMPEKGSHSLLIEFNRELFIDGYQDPSIAYNSKSSNPKKISNICKCLEEAINISLHEVFGV